MKHRKLRGYVLPTVYVILLVLIFGTVSLVSSLFKTNPNYLYSIGILRNVTTAVIENVDNNKEDKQIIRPYTSEKVTVKTGYYDSLADEESQANALIYFENTYMKNTGVLYVADEAFDVLAVLDGTVLNIKQDDILGNLVEIEHNTNLRTIYYSLNNVNVKAGDTVKQGEVIGVSGANNINKEVSNSLLFEVSYNGALINPEKFYEMNVNDLN